MGRISELRRRFQSGESTPAQFVDWQLALARLPNAHAVFTEVLEDRVRRQAQESTARWSRGQPLGPLDGIALSWKDLFDLRGTKTGCGSLVTSPVPAKDDAQAVARLHAAGVSSLGKSNLSEFAFSGLGMNPHFGTPVQVAPRTGAPHLLGGSSSGAAAALGLDIGCVAMGTDTSGSVRVPAAWSGLVGWRPSQQRYPRAGVAVLAPSLDTVGILAHSVDDVLELDPWLSGHGLESAEPAAAVEAHWQPPASCRFVLVSNFCGPDVQPAQRHNTLQFMDRLDRAGLACEQRMMQPFNTVADAFARHGTLVAAEAAASLASYAQQDLLARLDPFVRQRLLAARALPAESGHALRALRTRLMAEWADDSCREIFIFPTTPTTAPALDEVATLEAAARVNANALRHTMPGSFLDMPGISIPSGVDADGLPTSVLLSCRRGGDAWLLAAACQLEALGLFSA